MCKRWRTLASAAEFSVTVDGKSVMQAIEKAGPGDTVLIPPGYYQVLCSSRLCCSVALNCRFGQPCSCGLGANVSQETLLLDKPLKLVGLSHEDVKGRPRRCVVLQSSRPLVALCNAR